MRLSTNEKLIERQSKIARVATFAGLAVLVGSLVTTFTANFPIAIAYALLFVGFILAYVGSMYANRWIREPRADKALAKALKGMDNKYHLYNYLLPANHVLVTPTGLAVIRVKQNDGAISVKGDKWFTPFRLGRLFGGMGQEALGNPAADLRKEIDKIKAFLAGRVEGASELPIDGYVVFTDPKADLQIQESAVPVMRVDDLKDALRKGKRGPVLAPKLVEEIVRVLDEEADAKAA